MSKFENVHDWSYLADYMGIEVTDEEVDNAVKQLQKKGLYCGEVEPIDKRIGKRYEQSIQKLQMFSYTNKSDIKRDIKETKLKNKLRELAIGSVEETSQFNEDLAQDVRDFVSEHVENSMATSYKFFSKLNEIDDNYIFFTYLANNIKYLWW